MKKYNAQSSGVFVLAVLAIVPCNAAYYVQDPNYSALLIMFGGFSFLTGLYGFITYLKKYSDRGTFSILLGYILFAGFYRFYCMLSK